ncbi:leucine-rich repeat protein SHOC-2-like [Gigantopelta aegis]|uniref:leucine-rich repeat protein SHOC-2-like n=1 Tax=Gigantopelta aegis TaxID=1735272 RepID=UPI001B888891|nr:leucine-rich repeat protein SHOC-2-like [Gigantopelta aegis]
MSNYKGLFVLLTIIITCTQLATCGECPSSSPCSCSGRDIKCDAKNLISVPPLVGAPNTTYRLFLNRNPNLVIGDNSFSNITLEYVSLDSCRNISISSNAFKNQRKTLKELYISNTDLTKVPEELKDLEALQSLHIKSNKMQQWDLLLMEKLGLRLTTLDISRNGFTSWPKWLRHMTNLHWLEVSLNTFGMIPHDAFDAFHLRLNYLDIAETGISDMPTGLQTLHALTGLKVGGRTLYDSSFYENWLPSRISSLKSLIIMNTHITKIPLGVHQQWSLTSLNIQISDINYVEENVMPKNLTELILAYSLITRIHGGFCNPNLKVLNLGVNKITSIEKYDLRDCQNLMSLYIRKNEIHYISPTAFVRLKHLLFLDLQRNRFIHIPKAIGRLHSLSNLYLDGNHLTCTCQDEWFLQWRYNNTQTEHITGQCENLGIDLKDFKPHCSPIFVG